MCWGCAGDVLRDVLEVRAEDRLLPASILDFRARLGNRCKELPGNVLLRAAILDFGPRLKNHCKIFPRNTLQRAAIPDFMGSIWESLQGYARLRPPACSDSGFQGLNLEITAGFSPETPSGLQ